MKVSLFNLKILIFIKLKNSNKRISLFQPPSSFPTYIEWVPLCVIIEAQILTSILGGCVLGLWFILKINNYGGVYRGCVL